MTRPTPRLSRLRMRRRQRDAAESALRREVVRAFNDRDGYTVDDIAEAAGLSRPRIYQIVKESGHG